MPSVFFRKDSHGRKIYWIDYKDLAGVRHRKSIGPTERIALEVLADICGRKARQEFLGVIVDSKISFADFADQWWDLVRHTVSPATQRRWSAVVDGHLKPAFPGYLKSVSATAVQTYVAKRSAEGAAASTVNQETCVLKLIMRRAVEEKLLGRNPFLSDQGVTLKSVRPLREPPGRIRFLLPEEIERLLAAMEGFPYLEAFTLVAINSGLRLSEVLSLTHATVDWTNRIANIAMTKNGKAAAVPLNDIAINALQSLPRRLDGRMIPMSPSAIRAAFRRAVKRAEINNFRLHDLRHCFASYQAMAGTQSLGLQAMLRHSDPRMTSRYAHLSNQYLRDAVDRVQIGGGGRPAKPDKVG